jgi:hypothetical protein
MGLIMMNNNLDQISASQMSSQELNGLLYPKNELTVRTSVLESRNKYFENRGARKTLIKTGSKNSSVPKLKSKYEIQKTQSTKWVHFEPHIVASGLLE